MTESTKTTITVIVPAAGKSARANLSYNKVLAPVFGHPLLWWTLRALTCPAAIPDELVLVEVVVAARADEFAILRPLLDEAAAHHPGPAWRLVEGGCDRQSSVHAAVLAAGGDLVAVHDAARPLLSAAAAARVARAGLAHGAAILALPACDTVKIAGQVGGRPVVECTPERSSVWLAQTPQVFRRELLLQGLEAARQDGFCGTDCASLVERLRGPGGAALHPVTIVEGDPDNFKVTFAADLDRVARALAGQND